MYAKTVIQSCRVRFDRVESVFYSFADVAGASFVGFCLGFRAYGIGLGHGFRRAVSDMDIVVQPVKAQWYDTKILFSNINEEIMLVYY